MLNKQNLLRGKALTPNELSESGENKLEGKRRPYRIYFYIAGGGEGQGSMKQMGGEQGGVFCNWLSFSKW